MIYQYRKWYYEPEEPGSWAKFKYIYEIDHPQYDEYKIGYELIANDTIKEFRFEMSFEEINDLNYLKERRYKEVPVNLINKLNKFKTEANHKFIMATF